MSGPSFLGLGDERTRDLDYLLEDDPPRGYGRFYLALFLLILSGGLLVWHWQRDGYPWRLTPKAAVSSAPASPPSAAAPDPTAAAAPPVVPGEPTASTTPPDTKSTPGEGVQTPTEPTPAGQPSADSGISDNPAAAAKPADQALKQDQNPGEAAAQTPSPAASSPGSEPEVAEPAPATTKTPGARIATAATMPKAVAPKPSPAAPTATFEDRLVADGERYLYGRGVPEDCARAQRNLQIAARESNAKAQTLLGAMYATGHCVGRDLPVAYRWFAKALHGDPGNSRVQRDLEVLWKQMTPEERQVAMKSQ